MVYLIVRKTGTNFSLQNASVVVLLLKRAIDGLKHSIKTITQIVLCAPFATRIWRDRAFTRKAVVLSVNHTLDDYEIPFYVFVAQTLFNFIY